MSGALNALMLGGRAPGVIQTIPSVSGASPCDISIKNNGGIDSLAASLGAWVVPSAAGVAANYEVKVDPTAGAFSSGTTGTWLDCATTRVWMKSAGTVTYTISFREKGSLIVRSVQTGRTLQGL